MALDQSGNRHRDSPANAGRALCHVLRRIANLYECAHGVAMTQSPLEDPRLSGFAWGRFRRLMKLMGGVTLLVVVLVLGLFYREFGLVSIHFYIATALGVGIAVMLMAALMTLTFMSHATGHDEAVKHNQEGGESR
jgi:hypothetical protein